MIYFWIEGRPWGHGGMILNFCQLPERRICPGNRTFLGQLTRSSKCKPLFLTASLFGISFNSKFMLRGLILFNDLFMHRYIQLDDFWVKGVLLVVWVGKFWSIQFVGAILILRIPFWGFGFRSLTFHERKGLFHFSLFFWGVGLTTQFDF